MLSFWNLHMYNVTILNWTDSTIDKLYSIESHYNDCNIFINKMIRCV